MDWLYLLLKILIIFVIIGSVLEILNQIVSCSQIPVGDLTLFSEYKPNPKAKDILINLRKKRMDGRKISKTEYLDALERIIIEVEPSRLASWFGVVPMIGGDIGFVRNNLPFRIKLVVKRHELEHLLQTGLEKNGEWSANLATIKEYPLESLGMPIFAIRDRALFYRKAPLCLMINLWQTFKKYLLPF